MVSINQVETGDIGMQGQIDSPIHVRIPLPEKDFWGAFVLEKSFVVASMPNGNYNLTVRIAEGEGGAVGCEDGKDAQDSCALTLFSVDVGVELTTVKEEEVADFWGQEGGGREKCSRMKTCLLSNSAENWVPV